MRKALSTVVYFCSLASFAQTLTIKDEATGKPISDVFIYHENKTDLAYSDKNGSADISNFPSGLVFAQHPSYYQKSVTFLGNRIDINLTEKVIAFNEVVISANKWEQEEESVSQQILFINKRAIEFQNPQTAADMLAGTGEVFVQKSQLGGGSPKIRGFAANSVLIVVDGVRMNNAIFRGGNLQNIINIDPNALESSEVIFGPGSVIYGSDALGGVMDFHTVDPNWSDKTHVSGNLLGRYSSSANEKTGHLDFSISSPNIAFFHSTSFTSLDDLMAGSNRNDQYEGAFERKYYAERINGEDQLIENSDVNNQKFSGYDIFNSINKIKIKLNDNLDLGYGFYYSTTSDIPRYDNLTETIGTTDSLEAAEWYYGPQDWQMHNLRLNISKKNILFDRARVLGAYQKFEESRNDRDFGDSRLRVRTENVDMYSLSIDFDKKINNSNIYYGVDYFHNDVQSDGYRRNLESGEITETSSRYPNGGGDYNAVAVYGSLVNEITNRLVLNMGLRLSSVHLLGQTTDSTAVANDLATIDIKNNAINGAIGLAYQVRDNHKISYNISSGFRSPNIDDVGKIFEVGSKITVPNPDLNPEYVLNNEFSYELKNETFFLRSVVFYSRLFDAIVEQPFELNGLTQINNQDIVAKVNADEAEIYGASLVLRTELSRNIALEKAISWTGGKDISNNEPLRHTTPFFGKASFIYKQKKLRSEFFVEYNGNRNRSDIPGTEINNKPYLYTANGSPGWYTLNIRSSYQFGEFLQAQFGIENILDKHYRPYSSGISAPGRNVILTLRTTI